MNTKPEPKNMNTTAALQGYRSTLATLTLAIVAAMACLAMTVMTSCGSFNLPTSLPFDLGVRYQLETDLYLVATPKDKGGLEVKLEGTGQLSENIVFDGSAYVITSPNTGIVYRVSEGPTGRPLIEIIGGGNGRLQLVPADPPKPAIVEPVEPRT